MASTKEQRIGVRELKANLSAVLREVKAGKTILITERGKSVGRILPAEASTQDAIEEGVRRKMWAWSGRKWQPSLPKVRPRKGIQVSDLLLDDRE
jgi:prevent-host-death family protein